MILVYFDNNRVIYLMESSNQENNKLTFDGLVDECVILCINILRKEQNLGMLIAKEKTLEVIKRTKKNMT